MGFNSGFKGLIVLNASMLYNQIQEAGILSWRFLLYSVCPKLSFYFMKIFKLIFLNYQRQQQRKQRRTLWGYLTDPSTYTNTEREFKFMCCKTRQILIPYTPNFTKSILSNKPATCAVVYITKHLKIGIHYNSIKNCVPIWKRK